LFWKERDGKGWLTHNDTFYVQQRRNVPAELPPSIAVVNARFREAVEYLWCSGLS